MTHARTTEEKKEMWEKETRKRKEKIKT